MYRIMSGVSNDVLLILTSNKLDCLYENDEKLVIESVKSFIDAYYKKTNNMAVYAICNNFFHYYFNELEFSIESFEQDYISVVDSLGYECNISFDCFFNFIKISSVDQIIEYRSHFNSSDIVEIINYKITLRKIYENQKTKRSNI